MKLQATLPLTVISMIRSCDAFFLLAPHSLPLTFSPLKTQHGDRRVLKLNASVMDDSPGSTLPHNIASIAEDVQIANTVSKSVVGTAVSEVTKNPDQPQPKSKVPKKPAYPDGIFSPLVLMIKNLMGEAELNKLRAKGISLHSEVITSFVETSQTNFGKEVLMKLFDIVDRNGDGEIQADELATALESLGFSWLQQKQVLGILERADKDKNGVIDRDEFIEEAPKTLATNLKKLAKKNGGDLGFLS
jgi:hypothetical protein